MRKKDIAALYWSIKELLGYDAKYRIVVGERSNGKTYGILEHCLEQCWKEQCQMALVRRWKEDFRGKRGEQMFAGLVDSGAVERITGGVWAGIYYWSGRWYWCRWEEEEEKEPKVIKSDKPVAFGFALSDQEHDKSTSYPKVRYVFFDEFLTRSEMGYLTDEFVLFMNVLSTIIRDRDDVEIWMAANTVSMYSPYWNEMGIDPKKLQPGKIDLYEYGDSGLRVAIEFSDTTQRHRGKKPSDVYFAFNNPRLSMITGQNGIWEFALYPHCPEKYGPQDIKFIYFIKFDGEILQCEIVRKKGSMFTYIHRKSSELKNPDKDLIYSDEYSTRPNWRRNIRTASRPCDRKIGQFFRDEKVYYQDNQIGETVRGYLAWCDEH